MSKQKGKGGKNRRRGKNVGDEGKADLVLKEDGQEYAQVSGHDKQQATATQTQPSKQHFNSSRQLNWIQIESPRTESSACEFNSLDIQNELQQSTEMN